MSSGPDSGSTETATATMDAATTAPPSTTDPTSGSSGPPEPTTSETDGFSTEGSSSTGAPARQFCEEHEDALLCFDFDGDDPYEGLTVVEPNAQSVDTTVGPAPTGNLALGVLRELGDGPAYVAASLGAPQASLEIQFGIRVGSDCGGLSASRPGFLGVDWTATEGDLDLVLATNTTGWTAARSGGIAGARASLEFGVWLHVLVMIDTLGKMKTITVFVEDEMVLQVAADDLPEAFGAKTVIVIGSRDPVAAEGSCTVSYDSVLVAGLSD